MKPNAILIPFLAAFLVAGPQLTATPEKVGVLDLSEEQFRKALVERFQRQAGLAGDEIEITREGGIVILKGEVGHLLAKKRVVEIAKSLSDVEGVVDFVSLNPIDIEDQDVEKRVLRTLERELAITPEQMSATARFGVVELIGKTDTWAQKYVACQLAASEFGVREVVDGITVRPDAPPIDDEALLRDVRLGIEHDVWIDGRDLKFRVEGGTVFVAGGVPSMMERARVVLRIREAKGKPDTTELIVHQRAGDPLQKSLDRRLRSDEAIQKAIHDIFKLDPRIDATNIKVEVSNGEVVLTGATRNEVERLAAGRGARNAVGVFAVDNQLLPKVIPLKKRPV